MELLDKLVLPVSGQHLMLLNILLLIATILFVTYATMLLGSLALSIHYNGKAKKSGNEYYAHFSRDIIENITASPTMWFGFGIAPLISIVLLLTQLLHNTGSNAVPYLIFSFFALAAAIPVIYVYKNSLDFTGLIGKYNLSGDEEIEHYKHTNTSLYGITAFWGIVLMILTLWLFSAGINAATNAKLWDQSFLYIAFNSTVGFRLLYLIAASISIAAITFQFTHFGWDGGENHKDEKYTEFVRNISTRIAIATTMFVPLTFGMNVAATPKTAISNLMFAVSAIGVVLIFVAIHLVKGMNSEKNGKYANLAFYTAFFAFVFMYSQPHFAFTASNGLNVMKLADNFQKNHAHKEVAAVAVASGEDLYKTRCSACHKFDVKQVTAPAYDDVLGKYVDKPEDMIKFVSNPVPVNPKDYPSGMANQGLKPAEVKAVVEYLLNEYKKRKGISGGEAAAAPAQDTTKKQ